MVNQDPEKLTIHTLVTQKSSQPRYILGLLSESPQKYITLAQNLFQSVSDGYLLSSTSHPHITLCQIEGNFSQSLLEKVWQCIAIIFLTISFPQFLGLSFLKGADQ